MNLEKLMTHRIPGQRCELTARDAILYALGVGYGDRPGNESDLSLVYEGSPSFQVLPSMANVLAHPGLWIAHPDLGIDWLSTLHGEQGFEMFKRLLPGTAYTSRYEVRGVLDKGPGKGALMFVRKELREEATGELACTVDSTYFLRRDGGCGGTLHEAPAPHAIPDREPDQTVELATLPQAALIYRLSGDLNPLHADPAKAALAGFERPILHGLCSLGVSTRAVLRAACEGDGSRLRSLQLRFTAPVYPGETLVTDLWRDAGVISFRTRVAERDIVVLDKGRATLF